MTLDFSVHSCILKNSHTMCVFDLGSDKSILKFMENIANYYQHYKSKVVNKVPKCITKTV